MRKKLPACVGQCQCQCRQHSLSAADALPNETELLVERRRRLFLYCATH